MNVYNLNMNTNKNIKRTNFKIQDLRNEFFEQLKNEYDNFENWFKQKSEGDDWYYKTEDDLGNINSFLYTKEIECYIENLNKKRVEIQIFYISEINMNNEIQESLLLQCLWIWKKTNLDEIFVEFENTEKNKKFINIFREYGFELKEINENKDLLLIKNKNAIKDSNKKNYPNLFLKNNKTKGNILVFNQDWNYKNIEKEIKKKNPVVGGNIKNLFIVNYDDITIFNEGNIVFISKRGNENHEIRAFGLIDKVDKVKINGEKQTGYEKYLNEISKLYLFDKKGYDNIINGKNLIIIRFLYYDFFEENKYITMNEAGEKISFIPNLNELYYPIQCWGIEKMSLTNIQIKEVFKQLGIKK